MASRPTKLGCLKVTKGTTYWSRYMYLYVTNQAGSFKSNIFCTVPSYFAISVVVSVSGVFPPIRMMPSGTCQEQCCVLSKVKVFVTVFQCQCGLFPDKVRQVLAISFLYESNPPPQWVNPFIVWKAFTRNNLLILHCLFCLESYNSTDCQCPEEKLPQSLPLPDIKIPKSGSRISNTSMSMFTNWAGCFCPLRFDHHIKLVYGAWRYLTSIGFKWPQTLKLIKERKLKSFTVVVQLEDKI